MTRTLSGVNLLTSRTVQGWVCGREAGEDVLPEGIWYCFVLVQPVHGQSELLPVDEEEGSLRFVSDAQRRPWAALTKRRIQ